MTSDAQFGLCFTQRFLGRFVRGGNHYIAGGGYRGDTPASVARRPMVAGQCIGAHCALRFAARFGEHCAVFRRGLIVGQRPITVVRCLTIDLVGWLAPPTTKK